jgi:hypothetical protein
MHNYGDERDDPTRPDSPDSILADATLRFCEGARHIGVAVPLLCRLAGDERRYFAGRLKEDVAAFARDAYAFAELVGFIGAG